MTEETNLPRKSRGILKGTVGLVYVDGTFVGLAAIGPCATSGAYSLLNATIHIAAFLKLDAAEGRNLTGWKEGKLRKQAQAPVRMPEPETANGVSDRSHAQALGLRPVSYQDLALRPDWRGHSTLVYVSEHSSNRNILEGSPLKSGRIRPR